MEKLTEKDIEKIESLIILEKEILKAYNKLIHCDLNNKSKLLAEKEIVELEIKEIVLLEEFQNYNKDFAIVEYLIKKYNLKHIPNEFESYFNNTDDLLAVKRLISYFKPYADMSEKTYKEIKEDFDKTKDETEEELTYKAYTDSVEINRAIDKDNIFILLNNITEEINNNIYNLREYLTKLKYHIIYLSPSVESRYVENEFKETSHDYLEAKLQTELVDLKLSEVYDAIAKTKGWLLYENKLERLLQFTRDDFSDKEKLGEIIAYLAYIKTLTVILDNKTITKSIKELEEMMTPDNQDKLVIIRSIKLILIRSTNEKNKHRLVSMVRTRN